MLLLTPRNAQLSSLNKLSNKSAFSQHTEPKMAEKNQTCQVCGAPAGKHIYYGAKTCISCRGFFRRSVQSNHFKTFGCSGKTASTASGSESQCEIDSKTRKNCKRCRFEKCLSVGMRVTWVLSSEERCQRMLQRSRPKASLTSGAALLKFSRTEEERVKMLYNVTMELYNSLYYRMYASDLAIMRSSFFHSLKGRPLSFTEVRFVESMDRCVAKELVFKMCDLHHVTDARDVGLLASHNVPRIVGLYQSLVCKQGDMDSFMHEFIKYGWVNRNQSNEIEIVLAEIENMQLNDKHLIYNYEVLHKSPWAPHINLEERHRKITENINNWLRNGMNKEAEQDFDKHQLILITLAMVFHTDGITQPLTIDKSLVESIQLNYLEMLHRYLKDARPQKADSELANGVMILHDAKEAHEIQRKRLPV